MFSATAMVNKKIYFTSNEKYSNRWNWKESSGHVTKTQRSGLWWCAKKRYVASRSLTNCMLCERT